MDSRIIEVATLLSENNFKMARQRVDELEVASHIEQLELAETPEDQKEVLEQCMGLPRFQEILDEMSGKWHRLFSEARSRSNLVIIHILNRFRF